MAEIINFTDYKAEQEKKREKVELITKLNEKTLENDFNHAFYELLDIFCQKYYPDIYWQFDLYINGKLD